MTKKWSVSGLVSKVLNTFKRQPAVVSDVSPTDDASAFAQGVAGPLTFSKTTTATGASRGMTLGLGL